VQEGLSELTNPATWSNNPEIATRKFNKFVNILKSETQTYRDALKGLKSFEPQNTYLLQEQSNPLGLR